VSASKKKKDRQLSGEQEITEREQKRIQDEKSERRTMLIYTVVGIAVAVLAVAMFVLNSGIFQRNAVAATINGTEYKVADVQYYFNTTMSNYFGITPGSTDLKSITMDEKTGETAFDFVLETALDSMVTVAALSDEAKEAGYTLSEVGQKSIASTMEQLDSTWPLLGYSNRDSFVRANYGKYMTYERLEELLVQQTLADEYANSVILDKEFADSDYADYYAEHTNELDTYTYTQFVVQAKVETTDADGKTIEMTDDEKAAALEDAKEDAKVLAETLKDRLDAGEDPAALATEYKDDLYSSSVRASAMGSGMSSTFTEWMFDSARKADDSTLIESNLSSVTCNYYVLVFHSRERDETLTKQVRHILASDEETAYTLLGQWESGAATEDSFAELAVANSLDTGSARNGGLISGITPASNLVKNFLSWSIDADRKTGDTGVVESDYGFHVMYYVGDGMATWAQSVDNILRDEAYDDLLESAREGYEAVQGSGVKYIED